MKKIISKIKNPKVLKKIIIVTLIILIVAGYVYYQKSRDRIKIDNAQISAPMINIVPSMPGKLAELDVTEGHTVKTGDVLAVVGSETLRAQNNGLIILASNQVGGNVGVTAPLIQMIKTEDVRVTGTIDENKGLNLLKIGQVASFTVDAVPQKKFWGYVDEIAPSAKQTQIAFSISNERPTQQFQIYIRFNSSSYPEIKNGMSAKIVVYTNIH